MKHTSSSSQPPSDPQFKAVGELISEQETDKLGIILQHLAGINDCILLIGNLGVGKTSLARSFIKSALQEAGLTEDVPSPTFTLVQAYDGPTCSIAHFDLYRISGPDEIEELGFDEALETGIVLVEWPDRLGPYTPIDRLEIHLSFCRQDNLENQPNSNQRRVTLEAWGSWSARLKNALVEGKLNGFKQQ